MTLRKRIKSRFKLTLRRFGMLCRKSKPKTKRIRIAKTINPDGTITEHEKLEQQPIFEGNTFETELHIWKEIHKDVTKSKTNK